VTPAAGRLQHATGEWWFWGEPHQHAAPESPAIAENPLRPAKSTMATICKHPKVRVVSRHDDTEFVECLECGEIFDSEEFRDMEIEDTPGNDEKTDDA
jgi:hypothetical protein